ncbi:hypothetical protein DL95DRAFT_390669 [Leptodontidium sp. 2 PMI_412]|nr:hypothetical protein DL95DRAFT_390669 [Leptodontidium sp. 2 PMI_412]
MAPTQSQQRAVEIANGNLFDVFGNYDAISRREAIKSLYHEDCIAYEPYGVIFKGHDAIDKHVQEILDNNVDCEFKMVGPVKQMQNLVFIAWTFGPKGKKVAMEGTNHIVIEDGKVKVLSGVMKGTDHILVEDGKIKVLYGLVGDQADIKM